MVRCGSPLVIGVGHGEHFIGSDQLALSHVTDRFIFLDEGDSARIEPCNLQIFDRTFAPVTHPVVQAKACNDVITKGTHRHFMAKEIAD